MTRIVNYGTNRVPTSRFIVSADCIREMSWRGRDRGHFEAERVKTAFLLLKCLRTPPLLEPRRKFPLGSPAFPLLRCLRTPPLLEPRRKFPLGSPTFPLLRCLRTPPLLELRRSHCSHSTKWPLERAAYLEVLDELLDLPELRRQIGRRLCRSSTDQFVLFFAVWRTFLERRLSVAALSAACDQQRTCLLTLCTPFMYYIQGGHKSKPLPNYQKNVLNRIMPMRLDFFVKLKKRSSTIYYPLVLNILCVTYFLAPITAWPTK